MTVDNILKTEVLVLNSVWQPISIMNAFDAISDVFAGRAEIIDPTYCVHDFTSWVENWADIHEMEDITPHHVITTSQFSFPIPEIIKYYSANFLGSPKVKFSRKNVFKRDGNVCQYCAKEFPTAKLNIDHVIPRAHGGGTSWTNVVVSCIKCNTLKGHKSVEACGFRLLKKPVKPRWLSTPSRLGKNKQPPKSWENFLPKAASEDDVASAVYWNSELEKD